jgi:hypothetical protein
MFILLFLPAIPEVNEPAEIRRICVSSKWGRYEWRQLTETYDDFYQHKKL